VGKPTRPIGIFYVPDLLRISQPELEEDAQAKATENTRTMLGIFAESRCRLNLEIFGVVAVQPSDTTDKAGCKVPECIVGNNHRITMPAIALERFEGEPRCISHLSQPPSQQHGPAIAN
jgi:hypothetical protein